MVEISCDPGRLDVALIHAFLSEQSHWARGIGRATVERSLAHSLCFGAYDGGEQVGLARVVTDRATFAWLADVFVVEARRGEGIGAALMDAVIAHPDLQGLRRACLVTRTAPALYARYGYTPLNAPEIWMERFDAEVYARAAQTPPA
jgi:predicted N-acetyltransferase YhbS